MNKILSFLKNIRLSRIAVTIGYANWIAVVVILTMFFVNPKVTIKGIPYIIEEWMGIYLFYSFVPALISLILTFRVKKGYRLVNIAINVIFLWLYIIAFLFSRHMMMNG